MGPVDVPVVSEYKGRGDGSTMKALAWFGAEDVRMVDAPVPDITQDDDVVLQVTGTTICGSDLHLYHSEIVALQKGDILGHEVRFPHQSPLCSSHLTLLLVYGQSRAHRPQRQEPQGRTTCRCFFPDCMVSSFCRTLAFCSIFSYMQWTM